MREITSAKIAAETQMQYLDWMRRNDERVAVLRTHFAEAYTADHTKLNETASNPTEIAIELLLGEMRSLFRATPTLITSNAHDLIDEASALLPSDEVILESEIPSDPLMLWFERPYRYELLLPSEMDASPSEWMKEDWLVIAMTLRKENVVYPDGRTFTGLMIHVYGRPFNQERVNLNAFDTSTGGLLLIDIIGIKANISWDSEMYQDAPWMLGVKKWIIAMFRLMGDHIEQERVHVDRASRRRLDRLSFPSDGYISEVRLRKVVYADESKDAGTGVPLKFRHRVRGHWRKFFLPSMNRPVGDPQAYRYSYVNDYVRGPKSSPVIESQQVITLAK